MFLTVSAPRRGLFLQSCTAWHTTAKPTPPASGRQRWERCCQAVKTAPTPKLQPGHATSSGGGGGSSSGDGAAGPGGRTAEPPQATTEQQQQQAAVQGQPTEAEPAAAAPAAATKPSWLTARNLAFGGSVATVVLITVFRREIAPVVRWLIMQVNNLTDKSVIGDGVSPESLATGAAVLLTLYWSFAEFQRSSERMEKMEGMEEALAEREAAMEARLAAVEVLLGTAPPQSAPAEGSGPVAATLLVHAAAAGDAPPAAAAAAAHDPAAGQGMAAAAAAAAADDPTQVAALVQRVEALERQVASLMAELRQAQARC